MVRGAALASPSAGRDFGVRLCGLESGRCRSSDLGQVSACFLTQKRGALVLGGSGSCNTAADTGGTLGCFPSHWLPLAVDPLGEVTEGVKRAALLTCPGRASVCLLDFSFCKTVSRARLPVPQHISSSSLCPFLFVFFCNDCDWKAE